MDLKTVCGLALFLTITLWTVQVANSSPHKTYRNGDGSNDRSIGYNTEDDDDDPTSEDRHHRVYLHHQRGSAHKRSQAQHRDVRSHHRIDDELEPSSTPDPVDLQSVDFPSSSSSKKSLKSRRKSSHRFKSHNGRRGSKSWRRRGPSHRSTPPPRPREDEDDDEYDYSDDTDRHAYIMTPNRRPEAKQDEDDVISWAMDQHTKPHHQPHSKPSTTMRTPVAADKDTETEPETKAEEGGSADELKHDVYAYQLPSDLWFIVRYARDSDGHVEKYMNIVDSFTNYLDKLEEGVRTVSVNVKGVETVFRLTPKHKPFHNGSSKSSSTP